MTGDQTDLSSAQEALDAGDLTFAARQFRKVLAPIDEPAPPERIAAALVGLGRISYARADTRRAVLYAEEALRHDNSSEPARRLLADLTSRTQPPDLHDAWRREAALFQQ